MYVEKYICFFFFLLSNTILLLLFSCFWNLIYYYFFKDENNNYLTYDIKTSIINDINEKKKTIRYFNHQLLKYVWNDNENKFRCLQGLDNGTTTLSKLLEKCHGLTFEEHASQYV